MADKTSSYNVQGYNFVTLLKRLEAATSRLEDITIFQEQHAKSGKAEGASSASSVAGADVADSKALVPTPAPAAAPGTAPVPIEEEEEEEEEEGEEQSPIVTGFQSFIDANVAPFAELSKKIDPEIAEAVSYFLEGFNEEKLFLDMVSKTKPLSDERLMPLLEPIQTQIKKVMQFKEKYRGKFSNHANTLNEFVSILGWIVIKCAGGNNKPIKGYLSEINDSTTFWSNRIIKEYKDSDKTQIEWAREVNDIYAGLQQYVDDYHPTGLAWNLKGNDTPVASKAKSAPAPTASSAGAPRAAPAPSAGGAPPPPPPPPLPPASTFETEDEPKQETGLNAVFSAINQGTDITKGLKKVDKSQMTHKNPELKRTASSSSTGSKKSIPKPPKKPSALSSSKVKKASPPKKELTDTKWLVSNFENDHEITVPGEMDQSIFIGKCSNCTIKVTGKVNAITVSECAKVGILVESLISGIDIIKTTKFQLQPLGFVPLISVDQSHEGEIYLGKDSLGVEILSSQATSLNVYAADPEDTSEAPEFKENPLPEQIIHTFDKKSGKFTSSIVEASG